MPLVFARYLFSLLAVGSIAVFEAANPEFTKGVVWMPFLIAVVLSAHFAGFGPGLLALVIGLAAGVALSPAPSFILFSHAAFFTSVCLLILASTHANRVANRRAAQARGALEQREEQLHTMIEALPQGIWFSDREGNVIASNEAARKLFLEHNGRSDVLAPVIRRVLKGECIRNETFDFDLPGGELQKVLVTVLPLRHHEGERPLGTVVVSEDITERLAAMEELQRAKEQAEAASQAKDQFLAVLSHELRTPLTPVLMLAEALEESGEMPARHRADASMIRRHIALEARLIDDLLDLTRIEKGKLHLERHVVNVHEILTTAVEMMRGEAKAKRIGLSMNLDAKRTFIDADRARIKQVILNLINNALKFTPPGGAVAVQTADDGEAIRISVTDTGIGIMPEALATIFGAFEQAETEHRRFGGLGLGLAITRSLVELHGGEVEARSTGPGKGACFTIILPAMEEEPYRALAAPADDSQPGGGRLRILLVEDHEPTAFVLARLLKRRGHEVRVASSVAEAREQSDFHLDLLVSDIGLPDGSGVDVVRFYRSIQKSGFRAIALSGFGMEGDVDSSLRAGFDRHLTKPVDFLTLEGAISSLFGVET